MTISLGRVYIQGDNINVRKGPSKNYDVVRQVKKSDTFLVSQKQDGWIELEGNSEWVYDDSSYLQFLENTELDIATINGMGINVRKGPSRNYDVVKQLNKTDEIIKYDVYRVFNGWLNIGENQWIYYNPLYIIYV
ncbi:SH3 domain-containing protein [Bacillus thuringiensis]|uniref:SH3 domain-containing protein n=2 Tax=Bacillus thuringiensis TaxID=1428 RepID=UPI002ABA1753|nr:SH3 domain-containing protein [Bacillus thuringiensis]MDZ3952314.1 SH3 domain-containing protein [Bacillus thuringiensis]